MNIECPYCEELIIEHNDEDIYDQDVLHSMECKYCEKTFVFRTSISFHFEPEKADCLNDGKHDYQLTHTYPREMSKMRCPMCEDERELTPGERIKYAIGSVECYLKALNIL